MIVLGRLSGLLTIAQKHKKNLLDIILSFLLLLSPYLVEALEQEHYTRNHLGYRPEAPPPNFADVKSRINNKHDKKFAKKGKTTHQVQGM